VYSGRISSDGLVETSKVIVDGRERRLLLAWLLEEAETDKLSDDSSNAPGQEHTYYCPHTRKESCRVVGTRLDRHVVARRRPASEHGRQLCRAEVDGRVWQKTDMSKQGLSSHIMRSCLLLRGRTLSLLICIVRVPAVGTGDAERWKPEKEARGTEVKPGVVFTATFPQRRCALSRLSCRHWQPINPSYDASCS
jgi:hypothetical protein